MNLNIERDGKTCLQRCMGRFMWSLLVVSVLWCAHALKTVECSSAHCYRCMCVLCVCTFTSTHLKRISSSSFSSTVYTPRLCVRFMSISSFIFCRLVSWCCLCWCSCCYYCFHFVFPMRTFLCCCNISILFHIDSIESWLW